MKRIFSFLYDVCTFVGALLVVTFVAAIISWAIELFFENVLQIKTDTEWIIGVIVVLFSLWTGYKLITIILNENKKYGKEKRK